MDTMIIGGRRIKTRAYVGSFNLKSEMQEKKVGSLSGGERGRVHLAKTLREGCHLLLLAPTSYLLLISTDDTWQVQLAPTR